MTNTDRLVFSFMFDSYINSYISLFLTAHKQLITDVGFIARPCILYVGYQNHTA